MHIPDRQLHTASGGFGNDGSAPDFLASSILIARTFCPLRVANTLLTALWHEAHAAHDVALEEVFGIRSLGGMQFVVIDTQGKLLTSASGAIILLDTREEAAR